MSKWIKRMTEREWEDDPRRYGKIPGYVLKHPDISDGSKLLYAAMDMVMGGEGQAEMEEGLVDLMSINMCTAEKIRKEAKQ